ncbi:MAG: glycosyltransferase family 2 protein [Candidatus Aminicenantes bacterium]|jgi:predicted glycosyltransferase involved in capsule biosynthesis
MIALIVAIYNYQYIDNLHLLCLALKNQVYVQEIIIVNNDDKNKGFLKRLAEKFPKLVYIDSYDPGTSNNIALLRNKGAKATSAQYLYFSDADILFYDPNHFPGLESSLEKKPDSIIIQPKMYRLKNNISGFKSAYINQNKIQYNFDLNHCLYGYVPKKFEPLHEVKKEIDGQPYVIDRKTSGRINNKKIDHMQDFFWISFFHGGGIVCPKNTFEQVGGYCTDYRGWGCEDLDLIWKLRKICKVIYSYKEMPRLGVLHIEHPRSYNNAVYKRNSLLYDSRKNLDIDRVVKTDLNKYKLL